MAMIKCPECGKEISDMAKSCPNCGCPSEIFHKKEEHLEDYSICPECGSKNKVGMFTCKTCGHKYSLTEYEVIHNSDNSDFSGIYKYSSIYGKEEVRCPRCGGSDCSYFTEEKYIPEKKKETYSINLNPLKPFTLFNKKEKVIRKSYTQKIQKIRCNKCGCIFS